MLKRLNAWIRLLSGRSIHLSDCLLDDLVVSSVNQRNTLATLLNRVQNQGSQIFGYEFEIQKLKGQLQQLQQLREEQDARLAKHQQTLELLHTAVSGQHSRVTSLEEQWRRRAGIFFTESSKN